jgi:hypothetical protein
VTSVSLSQLSHSAAHVVASLDVTDVQCGDAGGCMWELRTPVLAGTHLQLLYYCESTTNICLHVCPVTSRSVICVIQGECDLLLL